MKRSFIPLILGALWFCISGAASAADMPWATAQSLAQATYTDAQSNGIKAVGPRVLDIERELAAAQDRLGVTDDDGTRHVLADGQAEMLVVLMEGAVDGKKQKVIADNNPYPILSLLLGSYYNEVGRPEDALRVLDRGLTLSPVSDMKLGATLPALICERAVTLAVLGRLDEALATYESGLPLAGKDNQMLARIHRGRGSVLTDLGRLDDAEAAYNESLKLEPGNTLAEHELKYIAHVRAGGRESKPNMILRKGTSD